MDTTPSKESLVEGLQSFNKEVDGVPTIRGMRNEGPYSPYYYKEKFGSWHDALRAAGIQPTHGVDPDIDREKLIDQLQMVNEEIDRPPRRREIEKHGDYSYKVYEDEFGSLVRALEEAGIEPTERQYRFSSVETPEEKKGSANLQILQEEGPTPASELPQGTSTKDRQRGVWKFKVDSGSTKPADPIHYLDGEHSPELVIRRFFEKNLHVLEYRDPHGIKIAVKNHRPSWKEIGREIINELYEQRTEQTPEFENLVVVRVYDDEALQYAFDGSVDTLVDTEELPITETETTGRRAVWGFSRADEPSWRELSERDGLLFSTKPGVFTHYVPVAETVENDDVMTELWVKYEDGIRTDGIDEPWPFVVLGDDVREVSIQEEELFNEIGSSLDEGPIQSFDEATLEPFSNSYGSFESYLRDRERTRNPSPSGVDPEDDPYTSDSELGDEPPVRDVVDHLLQVTEEDLSGFEDCSEIETVERAVREEAFREGIQEIYPGCAICGKRLEAPDGCVDLEAAHVLPKAEDGPDVLQNGLGLCTRHHWAFDHGWFEIGVSYEIRIREYPELEGYDTLQQYDGEYLHLPENEELQPHLFYIGQRNRLYQ